MAQSRSEEGWRGGLPAVLSEAWTDDTKCFKKAKGPEDEHRHRTNIELAMIWAACECETLAREHVEAQSCGMTVRYLQEGTLRVRLWASRV